MTAHLAGEHPRGPGLTSGRHLSTGNQNLARPVVGMIPNGTGYTVVDEAGNIYPFQ